MLYLPPWGRYFGCRDCHGLTYTSCRESHKYDKLWLWMAQELGQDFATFKRLRKRLARTRR